VVDGVVVDGVVVDGVVVDGVVVDGVVVDGVVVDGVVVDGVVVDGVVVDGVVVDGVVVVKVSLVLVADARGCPGARKSKGKANSSPRHRRASNRKWCAQSRLSEEHAMTAPTFDLRQAGELRSTALLMILALLMAWSPTGTGRSSTLWTAVSTASKSSCPRAWWCSQIAASSPVSH